MSAIRLQFSLAPISAGPGPFFIEWFDRGLRFSHVDAVLQDGHLLGAQRKWLGKWPPGVQVRDADYEAFRRVLVVELPTSALVEDLFYRFLKRQLGKPFDGWGQWAFLFYRDWRDPGRWFCSELIAAALEASGYFEHRLVSPANKITPGDLLLILSARVEITATE